MVTRSPLPPLLAGRPLSVPGFGDGDDGGGDDTDGNGSGSLIVDCFLFLLQLQTSLGLLFPQQPLPLHPSPR